MGASINGASVSNHVTFPAETHVGIWMWDAPGEYSDEKLTKFFTVAKNDGVNAVYVRIDDYVTLWERGHVGENIVSEKEQFVNNIDVFIEKASAYDISVYALAGGDTWAGVDYLYIPVLLTDFVLEYNKSSLPEKRLAGLHFDIESYSQPRFQNEELQLPILTEFVEMVAMLTAQIKQGDEDLILGITVSYWLDDETRKLPHVTYKGVVKPTIYHVIDIMDELPESDLIIMAYRNRADGENGAIDLVRHEMEYTVDTNVKVIVALETIFYPEEAHASFYGQSKDYFLIEANKVYEHYKNYPNFGGIAVHDMDGYLGLK